MLDEATLPPDQPAEIAASIELVTLTPALRDAIVDASPQVRLIRARVQEMIRARYSAEDEIKLLRLNVGAATPSADFVTYNEFVENCRQWSQAAKAELGL